MAIDIPGLAKTYWYILVLVFVIILLVIYSKQDDKTKHKINRVVFAPLTMGFFFLIILWIVMAKFGPIFTSVKLSTILIPPLLFAILWGYTWIQTLKYKTPQFVCPNAHGSYSSRWPIKKDGFLIFGIDSIDAEGVKLSDAQRIFIVREETAEQFLEGAVSIANLSKTMIDGLPHEVKEEILNNKFLREAKEEIYYGWFDDINHVDWSFNQLRQLADEKSNIKVVFNMLKKEFKTNNPKISTLLSAYINKCKDYNKLKEFFNSNIEGTDTALEHYKRGAELFKPSSSYSQPMDRPREEGQY